MEKAKFRVIVEKDVVVGQLRKWLSANRGLTLRDLATALSDDSVKTHLESIDIDELFSLSDKGTQKKPKRERITLKDSDKKTLNNKILELTPANKRDAAAKKTIKSAVEKALDGAIPLGSSTFDSQWTELRKAGKILEVPPTVNPGKKRGFAGDARFYKA